MPLLRMAARTAVVAGTATAVSGNVQRRQQGRWAEQDMQQQQPQQAAPPQEDPMAKLKELGELHQNGVLTDEEFSAAKAKIIG
jgi:membrane protease subunit (stomatin/prohibitin family)